MTGRPTGSLRPAFLKKTHTDMRISFHALALSFLLFCGCSAGEIEKDPAAEAADLRAQGKIINSPSSADCSTILLRLGAAPDSGFLARMKESGVVSVEPLFESVPGKEDLERRFNLDRWYLATVDERQPLEITAGKLSLEPAVELVQYPGFVEKASDCKAYPFYPETAATRAGEAVFNDPSLPRQWHYTNTGSKAVSVDAYAGGDINVKDVWTNLTCGDPSIIVAVVDEGVKYSHPDLIGNMWTDTDGSHGRNFVTGGEITWANTYIGSDGQRAGDSGHGTHCAGTIAAVNNNGIGVSGVAGGSGTGDGVRIMSCQIFDGDKGGSSDVVARAIKYAADKGASVISCSFGYRGGSFTSDKAYREGNRGANAAEYDAIRYFEATRNNPVLDGGIVIFASGNDGLPYATYPGALNEIISVSAFGPDFLPAYYTNYGPGCNIVAPGGEAYHRNSVDNYLIYGMVLSTVPSELDGSDYAFMQGTSMACPHVSGVVALALSYAKALGKTYSVKEFKDMIVTAANDFDKRLDGEKTLYSKNPIQLYNYRKRMGTGSIDAWKLLMKIEGIPSIPLETGREQWVDISDYFGTSSPNLDYLSVEVSDKTKASLGLAEDPYVKYGKLFIHPTRIGSGKIRISAVGGGNSVGGDEAIGGMEVTQEVSVIARPFVGENNGWL